MKNSENKSGIALVTVLCFMFLLLSAIAIMLNTSGSHVLIVKGQAGLEQAQFVAEAGVERAAAHIVTNGPTPVSFSGTLGDGVYVVTIIKGETSSAGSNTVAGVININPNNNPDNEFIVTLSSGLTITRDDLVQDYPGYNGTATSVHVKPKGNGNQNGLIVNGEAITLENKNTYDIASGVMAINIYNDNINGQGKAVGKWYIAISSTAAVITISP